jgi:hypothetical protein
MGQLLIKMEGQFRFLEKASLVAYDFRELHKKSELKIVKSGYVRGCPKQPATQIWSLEILRVNP